MLERGRSAAGPLRQQELILVITDGQPFQWPLRGRPRCDLKDFKKTFIEAMGKVFQWPLRGRLLCDSRS